MRPEPLPRAPDLGAHLDVLRELLGVQRERLRAARALEVERAFIFPETTVIAKDVARLSAAVHLGSTAGESQDPGAGERPEDPDLGDDDGRLDLAALIAEGERE